MRTKKQKKITRNGTRAPNAVRRDIGGWSTISSQFGRTQVRADCPFCHQTVDAYLWSLAGGGKRCECGALLTQVWAIQFAEIRLEYLRGELRAGRISYGEIAELQSLAKHIDAGDTELLEAAGVPENSRV